MKYAFFLVFVFLLACPSSVTVRSYRSKLVVLLDTPIRTKEDSQRVSQELSKILAEKPLHRMRRHEVQAMFGKGDICSRHPLCFKNDFKPNDWFYHVGREEGYSESPPPKLIIGFDNEGFVERTWQLRTHQK